MNAAILFVVLLQSPFDFRDKGVSPASTVKGLMAEREQLLKELAVYRSNPLLQLHGLSDLKVESRPVQWVITTSPSCGPCHAFVNLLNRDLKPLGWKIGEESDAQFCIKSISETTWQQLGITLPRAELFRDGKLVEAIYGEKLNPSRMAQEYIARVKERELLPAEQVAELALGTVTAKTQVTQILNALIPFLDGGTLDVTYTPKAGVVKEWLTIKQGNAGVKIPAKTQIRLSINNGQLDIVPQGTKPMVIAGPFERSIDSIELSANKLSIRLPWMVDPEWNIK